MASESLLHRIRRDLPVIGYCLIVGLAATSFGFDQGLTGGFFSMKQYNKDLGYYDKAKGVYAMTAESQTMMMGIEIGSVLVAAVISGYIGSKWGRKVGLVIGNLIGILGVGIQMISHFAAAVVGRALMGVSIAFAAQFCIPYWSEAAPVYLRGFIVVFYQFFINLPTFIGSCVDQGTYKLDNPLAYRIPLVVAMAAPAALLCLIWIVPESPRWLITHGRIEEAKVSMSKIRGRHASVDDVDQEVREIIAYVELEKALESSTSYAECFKGTELCRTLIASVIAAGGQLMGVGFIGAYSTYFFDVIGFSNAFLVTVIVSLCSVAGVLVAFMIVNYVGRRPIMITGSGVLTFCMLAFAVVAQATPARNKAAAKFIIFCICCYSFTYSASWGSVGSVMMGEVPSNRLRSKTLAIAMSASWVSALTVITAIPYLLSAQYANLGTKVGFIFGSIGVCIFIVSWIIIPETKGRSLEQLDEMFMNRIPTREFKSYVCTGLVAGYDVNTFGDEKRAVMGESTHVEKV
ncbi:sugar transporter, putative [Talaromyces stipitatus ATCC 10500]|uniref:Sugar transporter, putative n=1 Tax=Talaromyces stipitatus (strain ATCC 10500 / CBS 375.48 / QM 6759 / NRRL 1006) TaxID=441959 RepID=B8M5E0_TALSN|nr:sugar transporter, putative [Talaromyces stipitatus ATCC 10500]EED19746.1 sugar transporter, putative [Talaromyces stipitatus ATCC 10500]